MLDGLAADYANHRIGRSEWMTARGHIQGRIDAAELPLTRQAVDSAGPGRPRRGTSGENRVGAGPERVEPIWRL